MLTLTTDVSWYAKYKFVPKEEFYRKQFKENMSSVFLSI